jgi:hypothetical protein
MEIPDVFHVGQRVRTTKSSKEKGEISKLDLENRRAIVRWDGRPQARQIWKSLDTLVDDSEPSTRPWVVTRQRQLEAEGRAPLEAFTCTYTADTEDQDKAKSLLSSLGMRVADLEADPFNKWTVVKSNFRETEDKKDQRKYVKHQILYARR